MDYLKKNVLVNSGYGTYWTVFINCFVPSKHVKEKKLVSILWVRWLHPPMNKISGSPFSAVNVFKNFIKIPNIKINKKFNCCCWTNCFVLIQFLSSSDVIYCSIKNLNLTIWISARAGNPFSLTFCLNRHNGNADVVSSVSIYCKSWKITH